MAATTFDQHLQAFDPAQRAALTKTLDTIRRVLPGATEEISYGMPTFKIGGIAVVGIEGFKKHNSLFPYSGSVIEMLSESLPGQVTSKGTVQFERDKPFPASLLKKVLKTRITEINSTFPKKNGETKEFFDNGRLKLEGRTRAGQVQGPWRWYRRDGSLMRSGSFKDGAQVGEWVTYDRESLPVKTTQF